MAHSFRAYSLAAFLVLYLSFAAGQTSRRSPLPRAAPDTKVFDTIEKQQEGDRRAELAKSEAARQQRHVQAADLAKDLLRLRTLTQALQERLNSTDLRNSLPADLRKQSAALEHLARDINRKVRSL